MKTYPVGGRPERDSVWSIGQWPDFCDDDPCTRTPRVTEMDDEQPDHDDGCPSGALVVGPVVGEAAHDGCDDEVGQRHTNRTDDERGFTAPFIDVHDGGDYILQLLRIRRYWSQWTYWLQ